MTAAARNRVSLIAYFRARHLERDRLRLVGFTFTGNWNGYGNFIFRMRRSAADYHRGAWFGLIRKRRCPLFPPTIAAARAVDRYERRRPELGLALIRRA